MNRVDGKFDMGVTEGAENDMGSKKEGYKLLKERAVDQKLLEKHRFEFLFIFSFDLYIFTFILFDLLNNFLGN